MNWRIIKPPIRVATQEKKLTLNKDIVDIFSFGNRRFISSIYWIETLMDSDLKHYQKDDLGNWMYNRFDTITQLDPLFYEAYLFGGIYLSIVKDDEKGAKLIYEKGLEKFPSDLELLYNAGFNDYFELNNEDDAVKKFNKIAQDPKGIKKYPFIVSLSEKIKRQQGGSLEDTFKALMEVYEKTQKNDFVRSFYAKTLYGLKAEIDLTCLNSLKQNCSKVDFEGNPYLYHKGKKLFYARKKWKKFQVRKKVKN